MDLNRTDSKSLARLFKLDTAAEKLWHEDELAEVLVHQLKAPLRIDLGGPSATSAEVLRQSSEKITSFGALFAHEKPPIQLLILVKQFAKQFLSGSEGAVPREIGTVLYYAAIVAAMTRRRVKISELSEASLNTGLTWALQQSWLDSATRSLFEEGRRGISSWSECPKHTDAGN